AYLTLGLGILLLALFIPTAGEGGWLNALIGSLALAIALFILRAVRRYERLHLGTASTTSASSAS
ncbi:MAG: hypothetical protein ACOC3I_11475, partial [Verrucomicrobiota bacterium]